MLLAHVPHTIQATVTSKGQVTIPAEVRKHLGISETDKILFVIGADGNVHLELPQYPNIASLRGAAGSLKHPKTWKEIKEIVSEERALQGNK